VDLPTYTNIWRIEKRLYKLYDLRLPMPLPLVQIGVFVGIFLPWIILLQIIQVPFHAPWHVVYIVPPGVLTWLATRPVIEGKRLTELMISQIRYLTEAKTWARLTPIREPDEVAIVGRVWLRRGVSGRVHAGRERARQAQPAVAAATQADQSAPPLQGHEAPVRPAVVGRAVAQQTGRVSEGQSWRDGAAARPQRPRLRPTPQEGTGTVSPSGSPAGRVRPGGRRSARPGADDPWATRIDDPNATRADNPRMPAAGDPNATRIDSGDSRRPGSDDPRITRPESVRRDQAPPAPQRAHGFPAPAGRPADERPSDARQGTPRPEVPATETERPPGGPASPGTPHRAARRRSASHEPERPAAATGPTPVVPTAKTDPPGRGTLPAPPRPGAPSTPGRPGTPSPSGRTDEPPGPVQPGTPSRTDQSGTPATAGQPGESLDPGWPGAPSGAGPSGTPAGVSGDASDPGRSSAPSEAERSGASPVSVESRGPSAPERSGDASEPVRPAATSGPRPADASPVPGSDEGSDLGRSGGPSEPERSGESSDPGRPGVSSVPAESGEPSAPERSGAPVGSERSGASPAGPGEAETPPLTFPPPPTESATTIGRHAASTRRSPDSTTEESPDPAAEGGPDAPRSGEDITRSPDAERSDAEPDAERTDAEETEESTPTAPVIRLVPGGKHAKPGGRGSVAHEPPAASERSGSDRSGSERLGSERASSEWPGKEQEQDESRSAAESAAEGGTAARDDEDVIAEARTDQIVWPARGPRPATPGPDSDPAQGTPARPSQGPPPGPFARRGGQARGRSHGEDSPAQGPVRPSAPAASASPAPPTQKPAQEPPRRPVQSPAQGPAADPAQTTGPIRPPVRPSAPAASASPAPPTQKPAHEPARRPVQGPAADPAQTTGPVQRPVPPRSGMPPKAPAAGFTPPAQVPLPPAAAPQRGAPARPSTPPARPGAPQGWDPGAAPPESPARGVRSGPASPVRPGPMPQTGNEAEGRDDDGRGLRRIFSGGGHGDGDYEQRVRTAFEGARRVVVLGCTGGAGQTVTGLMLGHTFAQHRGDRIVAVDVNPGPGAMARRTRTETRETLTSLITHAEQVTGYQMMRRYTSVSKSGLEVVAAGKNPVQALDDRDYALAMRTLDRFYAVTLLDAAAAVVARVLPYADQIVLVAPASSDAPRAVAMTFEWLDGHGYEDLRTKAVTVINGVSRRSMDDVEQAESVARGRCRALVRIPWDDHLSLDRAPRNELRTLRSSTRKAYIALGGVVAGGLVQVPDRYPRQEVSR
jgi:MinD-like ATPase involved in chromosome partitioning or flagellar assembly